MIPKLVHIAWKDKNVINDDSLLIVNGIDNIKKLNSDWTLTVSDDHDIDYYLKQCLTSSDYLLIKNTGIVDRCDLWRLFKIYNEGGLYVDIDRFYNIPMSKILSPEIKWLLPINNYFDFSQDLMCSEPENPVFARTIELNLSRRRQGITHTYFLGAQTYMHAITEILTGKIIDTDPGREFFIDLEQKIKTISFIKTQIETFPHDTMIYYDPSKSLDLSTLKTELYARYNVKHWDRDQ